MSSIIGYIQAPRRRKLKQKINITSAVNSSTIVHAFGEFRKGLSFDAPSPSAEKKIRLARLAPSAKGNK